MKLSNKNIKLETNEQGEIKSIKFHDQEIMHEGKEWWPKTAPVIWPNISNSLGFVVNGKNYELPRHGFWKELKWDQIYEGESISMLSTHFPTERFPFTIDIQNNISIEDNKVIFKTIFTNLGKEESYFHFGHHPAFKIDKNSEILIDSKEDPQMILSDGKLSKERYKLNKIMNIPFGESFDTLVYKDVNFNESIIQANGLNITVGWDGFNSLQIWKPREALFVCVEPWQGWNDQEYDSPKEAKDKLEIISLMPGETTTKTLTIQITKNN